MKENKHHNILARLGKQVAYLTAQGNNINQ